MKSGACLYRNPFWNAPNGFQYRNKGGERPAAALLPPLLAYQLCLMIPFRRFMFLVPAYVCIATSVAAAQGKTVPKAAPQEQAPPPPAVVPYEGKLMRLAEVVGSVHYLRTLCKAPGAAQWRADMQALLDSETNNEPQRKARLTAAFNRGYRAFASVYTGCTPSAIVAEERYRSEGATLSTEITSRFGN
jgi:uncharacterized protein (TIGR02301 family)